MNWRRGAFRLWVAASAIWTLLTIAITFGPKMLTDAGHFDSHPPSGQATRLSAEIKLNGKIFEAPNQEAALAEGYRRGLLPPDMKDLYEEAQRRGLLPADSGKMAVNPDTGEVLYLDREANEWKPALTLVIPKTRELFGFSGKEWQKITLHGPGITRRIEDALRAAADQAEGRKEWVTVEFPGIGDVKLSPNFELLSGEEKKTRARELFELLKSRTETSLPSSPARFVLPSELVSPSFWITVLGPPAAVGIVLLLMGWIIAGFRRSEAKS
jgi:hypothetical protein